MKTTQELVTPAIARAWLKRNVCNRPLREPEVEDMRAAFERGEWELTHQGIAFDDHGDLIDGQHRLHAIALQPEGFRCMMLVSRGLNRARVFPVVDKHQRRTLADSLGIDRGLGTCASFLARLMDPTHQPSAKFTK